MGERPAGDSWGAEPSENWGRLTLSDGQIATSRIVPTVRGDYRCFYENLRDALAGKASIAVTASQALNVMRILELARRSSALHAGVAWTAL